MTIVAVAGALAPKVSVIVPAYGVAHLLGDALSSLQAQRRQDWEAIVVDDGAPDDVGAAFAPFASDARFRLLRTDNRGLATARNRAIAASSAPLVSLLDGDDVYEPDYLERMIAAIEVDDRLGFVTCDATFFGESPRVGERYSSRHPITGPISLERVLTRNINIFVASIIRRSALEQVGGFDGELRAAEDLDLWIRLLEAGWHGDTVFEPLVRYRRRPESLSADTRHMLLACRSVYDKAVARMDGRPEQMTAHCMLLACQDELRWFDGENLILAGDLVAGLPLLAGAERRSPRWRMALAIMQTFPGLSRYLLRARARLPAPRWR